MTSILERINEKSSFSVSKVQAKLVTSLVNSALVNYIVTEKVSLNT